jgi:hypothetical protein
MIYLHEFPKCAYDDIYFLSELNRNTVWIKYRNGHASIGLKLCKGEKNYSQSG